MSTNQTTTDLEEQIAKLEAKLNELLDQVQKNPPQTPPPQQPPSQTSTPPPAQEQTPPQQTSTTTGGYGKSKQQILEEYEKGYLKRMEKAKQEQAEIRRAAAELEAKKKAEQSGSQPSSTRGSLPKGF